MSASAVKHWEITANSLQSFCFLETEWIFCSNQLRQTRCSSACVSFGLWRKEKYLVCIRLLCINRAINCTQTTDTVFLVFCNCSFHFSLGVIGRCCALHHQTLDSNFTRENGNYIIQSGIGLRSWLYTLPVLIIPNYALYWKSFVHLSIKTSVINLALARTTCRLVFSRIALQLKLEWALFAVTIIFFRNSLLAWQCFLRSYFLP